MSLGSKRPRPSAATSPAGCKGLTTAEASVCKQRLSMLDAAAASGRAASGDWAAHLAMMRAHADGDFGAEHAQEMWVMAW